MGSRFAQRAHNRARIVELLQQFVHLRSATDNASLPFLLFLSLAYGKFLYIAANGDWMSKKAIAQRHPLGFCSPYKRRFSHARLRPVSRQFEYCDIWGAGNSERPGMGTGMIRGYRRSNERDERLARKRGDRGDQRWAFFDPLLPRYLPSKAGPREAAKNTENFSNLSTLFSVLFSSLSSLYFGLFSTRTDEFLSRMASQIALASSDTAIRSEVRVCPLTSDTKRC